MAVIHVEGRAYEVQAGPNLLQAILGLGFDLPYFCWHPALGAVGACRQCAVKQFQDADDTRGRIVMACMTPVAEGLRISVHDPEAIAFRRSVIEWLMTNHPHDCPVCDEGGECHLQDMTVMTGHAHRRHRFAKRTFRNQDLGPLVHHEMNRCIQCFRCVRFYGDYAGGTDLVALGSRNRTYFGRFRDGTLESPFAGNLVEVCPTGVFTDKPLRQHYSRKWDLQTAPSICVHCGLGCNTIAGERYGELRRILNRYHPEVNGYFLCDRGRFGYGFASGPRRLRDVQLREDRSAALRGATADQALERAAAALRDGARLIGIGSPRASLEANYALRALVGPERFCNGLARAEAALTATTLRLLRETPARVPSLRDIERADAVLILGEDVTATAPRCALALRQAARRQPARDAISLGIAEWNDAFMRLVEDGRHGPVHLATPAATALDPLARTARRAVPEEIARLGFAVAHGIDPASPEPAALAAETASAARAIAADLLAAERPLVVSGMGAGGEAVLHAAARVARALVARGKPAALCLTVPECNTLGAGMLSERGLEWAEQHAADGEIDVAIVLENDLGRRMGSAGLGTWFARVRHLVVIDCIATDLVARAEVVLPAASFAEASGTLLSGEGRLQRVHAVHPAPEPLRASWRWLCQLGSQSGIERRWCWETIEDVAAALAADVPALAAIRDLRAQNALPPVAAGRFVPRQSERSSGRTSMRANVSVHEAPPPADPDAPFAFSMEGYAGPPPPASIPRYSAPGWNSVQALNQFQEEIAGPLRGGEPGRRIFERAADEPGAAGASVADGTPPPPFVARPEVWRVVALHHTFGSEELSALAPAIASLAPTPYAALNNDDAARLGAAEGDALEITVGAETRSLPLRLAPELPAGVLGLPAGLPGATDLLAAQGEGDAARVRAGRPA
jgi:NADH-quinone oxidoreductase subunit G